jgi:hypothetical protein
MVTNKVRETIDGKIREYYQGRDTTLLDPAVFSPPAGTPPPANAFGVFDLPICNPVENERTSVTNPAHPMPPAYTSCGKYTDFQINAINASGQDNPPTTPPLGPGTKEAAHLRGSYIQNLKCHTQQVINEINNGVLQAGSCADAGSAIGSNAVILARINSTTAGLCLGGQPAPDPNNPLDPYEQWSTRFCGEQMPGQITSSGITGQEAVESLIASWGTSTEGARRLQAVCQLAAARGNVEAAFAELALCEIFTRTRIAWQNRVNVLLNYMRDNVTVFCMDRAQADPAATSTFTPGCPCITLPPPIDTVCIGGSDCQPRDYQDPVKIFPLFRKCYGSEASPGGPYPWPPSDGQGGLYYETMKQWLQTEWPDSGACQSRREEPPPLFLVASLFNLAGFFRRRPARPPRKRRWRKFLLLGALITGLVIVPVGLRVHRTVCLAQQQAQAANVGDVAAAAGVGAAIGMFTPFGPIMGAIFGALIFMVLCDLVDLINDIIETAGEIVSFNNWHPRPLPVPSMCTPGTPGTVNTPPEPVFYCADVNGIPVTAARAAACCVADPAGPPGNLRAPKVPPCGDPPGGRDVPNIVVVMDITNNRALGAIGEAAQLLDLGDQEITPGGTPPLSLAGAVQSGATMSAAKLKKGDEASLAGERSRQASQAEKKKRPGGGGAGLLGGGGAGLMDAFGTSGKGLDSGTTGEEGATGTGSSDTGGDAKYGTGGGAVTSGGGRADGAALSHAGGHHVLDLTGTDEQGGKGEGDGSGKGEGDGNDISPAGPDTIFQIVSRRYQKKTKDWPPVKDDGPKESAAPKKLKKSEMDELTRRADLEGLR